MSNNIKYISLLAFFTLMMFSSCIKNETCLSANNLLKTETYIVNDEGELVITAMDSMSLFILGREDTMLYNNVKDKSTFSIPLSDTAEQIIAVLNINEGTDTIWINYKPYPVFRSTECGVINRYEIFELNYTQNKVWGMAILDNQVDEREETNILLVFRTN
ncbi:MAG: hypothetical protein GQ527_05155 [Bacteroidales bacterium]|nr:hypothetical protein [Bacteroidales bacterium]